MKGLFPAVRPFESDRDRKANNFGAIRLGLAFLVILSHSPELVDGNRSRELLTAVFHTLSFGELAVDGFFIVSGYLITASYLHSGSGVDFLAKRVLRIYPGFVAAAAVCVFGVAPWVGGAVDFGHPEVFRRFAKVAAFLGVPTVPGAFAALPYPSLNGSLWTIRFEFGAYLSALALGSTGLLRRRRVVLGLTLALLVAEPVLRLVAEPSLPAFEPYRKFVSWNLSVVVRLFGLFFSGACFNLYADRLRFTAKRAAVTAAVLCVSMFSIWLAHVAVATLGAYLLFYLAEHVDSSMLSRVGAKNDISYGVYLYAWPLQSMIIWFHPQVSPWTVFLVTTCAILPVAYLSWKCVEQPAIRLKGVLGRGRPMSRSPESRRPPSEVVGAVRSSGEEGSR